MAKRGQRLPYRVTYSWDNDVSGSTARPTLDSAEFLANQIEESAHSRELGVTIVVSHVATPGGAATVIATRNIDPADWTT